MDDFAARRDIVGADARNAAVFALMRSIGADDEAVVGNTCSNFQRLLITAKVLQMVLFLQPVESTSEFHKL